MVEEKTSQGTWLLASSTDTVEWSDLSPISEMTRTCSIQKPIDLIEAYRRQFENRRLF